MFSPETCWLKTPIPLTSVHNHDKLYLKLKEHFYNISQKQIELKPTSMYSLALLTYLQHKHLVDYLLVYDDWMKDVQVETAKLLEALDIPNSYLQFAMAALNKDSQNNFFVQSKVKKVDIFTQDQLKRIDWVYQILDLPFKYDMDLEEFKNTLLNVQK